MHAYIHTYIPFAFSRRTALRVRGFAMLLVEPAPTQESMHAMNNSHRASTALLTAVRSGSRLNVRVMRTERNTPLTVCCQASKLCNHVLTNRARYTAHLAFVLGLGR